ncbi:MAG: hypothetical protein HOC71_12580, partial [Candidatus Latescibacteria bacterium]|nr:hypothetical protein [Candidatus Latescibacterota bacterium]
MRLTDLLRNNDGKKKPASSIFSKSGEQSPQQETAKSFPGKGDKKAVHLQADDLAALYNINIPEDTSSTSPSTGQEPDTPRETEQKTDIPVDVHENEQTDADVSDEETYKEAPREIEEERKVDIRNDVSANTAPKKPVGGEDGFDDKLERESADAIHIELLDALDDVYEEGKTGKEIYTERLIPPINRLIELCKHSNAILRKAIRLKKGGKSFTTHSLNLAILAAKIGLVRNYPYERVFSLTLCALLGDIGMTRVDPAILNKSGKLTPEEFQEIKNHINYSVEVVRGVSRKFPFLAPIIYQ